MKTFNDYFPDPMFAKLIVRYIKKQASDSVVVEALLEINSLLLLYEM